jgi:hypothetical protein
MRTVTLLPPMGRLDRSGDRENPAKILAHFGPQHGAPFWAQNGTHFGTQNGAHLVWYPLLTRYRILRHHVKSPESRQWVGCVMLIRVIANINCHGCAFSNASKFNADCERPNKPCTTERSEAQ